MRSPRHTRLLIRGLLQPRVKDAGVAVILDKRVDGALEVLILLQVSHMQNLVADADFMALVQRVVE